MWQVIVFESIYITYNNTKTHQPSFCNFFSASEDLSYSTWPVEQEASSRITRFVDCRLSALPLGLVESKGEVISPSHYLFFATSQIFGRTWLDQGTGRRETLGTRLLNSAPLLVILKFWGKSYPFIRQCKWEEPTFEGDILIFFTNRKSKRCSKQILPWGSRESMVNESEENVTQGERSKEEVLWSSVKANASEKELPIL